MLTLVGRELCLFLSVDASRVPARQRESYLALAVSRAAPFADPAHDALWSDGHAAAWYWSKSRVRDAVGAAGAVRAEPMFRGDAGAGDRVEVLALAAPGADAREGGFEARIWRDGHLAASRWWRQLPDDRAWRAFVRGAGLSPELSLPEPVPAPLRVDPLRDGGRRASFAGDLGARKAVLAIALATVCLGLLAWQVGGVARAAWRTHLLERETARLSARMESIIAARDRADAARTRIEAMLALRPPASQTRLLGEVQRITPGTWQLLQWRQPGPETLEVTLRAQSPDVAAIVSAWEASPLLQDVTPATSSRGDELTLQARLTPLVRQQEAAR